MKVIRFVITAVLAIAIGAVIVAFVQNTSQGEDVRHSLFNFSGEGSFPSLSSATQWINSPSLTPEGLRGKVVLVDFWTYTCVNWQRTFPYVQAWADKYKDQGLVVIGVHTPEFTFEHDLDNVRREVHDLGVDYPVAVDNDYGVWNAFSNNYWPALYLIDAKGQIRYHQFGEGNYEQSEMMIQQLLTEAGSQNIRQGLVTVNPTGLEVAANWNDVRSSENYLSYNRTQGFASPGDSVLGESHVYTVPDQLSQNEWALSGNWTFQNEFARLNQPNGKIVYRFRARDVNLVMGPAAAGTTVRFRVRIDGHAPGAAHGTDVDDHGNGTVTEQGTYQLIRQPQPITDRTFEIEFLDAGVEAYDFTFG
ncbi:MAG: redoxin domain-containing protein [Chloroflexi bacterium]|nr:redoxin domain-containing protein [Chloroflexota bacterium]